MKIGIDCRMYGTQFTGIGRYVYELTRNLAREDTKNQYVLFFNNPEFDDFRPFNKRFKKVLVGAKHYSLKEQTTFLRKIKKEKLDLMHFTHFNAPMLYEGKSIVTIHDLTLSFFPGKKMRNPLRRLGYHMVLRASTQQASHVIAVSENTKQDLLEEVGIPEKNISVIYEGVSERFKPATDEKEIERIRSKYELPERFLLYAGVWRSHKNVVGLIKAFDILKKQHAYEGKLVITGKKDPTYAEVTNHVENLGLEEDVIFTGLVPEDDLITILGVAEAFVFPSYYEGFGLPILEAFACKTPVISSDASCLPEICGEGAAQFFNPYDASDMADKIFRVVSSEALKKNLIEAGSKRLKDFSWRKMARQTLRVYQRVESTK